MKIVLVTDQANVVTTISAILADAGQACKVVREANTLARCLSRDTVDLLMLDLCTPGITEQAIARWPTEQLEHSSILLLVGPENRRAMPFALKLGAGEYVAKPIDRNLLAARVAAITRLAACKERKAASEVYGRYRFDLYARRLFIDDREVELTAREYELALLLFRNEGRMLSRSYLYEHLWGASPDIQSRTLDVHICKLRAKAGLIPQNGCHLSADYGLGYRFGRAGSVSRDTT